MKPLILLALSLSLVACSGTGEKYNSSIDTQTTSETGKVFITRESGFGGSGTLVAVVLNGNQIGEIGNDEILIADSKGGDNIISARTTGVGSLFYGSDEYTFSNDGSTNSYFVLTLKNSILNNRIIIQETTEKSWKQLAQD